jgi:hypothetical protein
MVCEFPLPVKRGKIHGVASGFATRKRLVQISAPILLLGSAYSCLLWMDAIGNVSGWTELPQYAGRIPGLQRNGTLCFGLMVALTALAAFVLGQRKTAPQNRLESFDDLVVLVLNYAGRLLICALVVIALVVLLHIVALLGNKA